MGVSNLVGETALRLMSSILDSDSTDPLPICHAPNSYKGNNLVSGLMPQTAASTYFRPLSSVCGLLFGFAIVTGFLLSDSSSQPVPHLTACLRYWIEFVPSQAFWLWLVDAVAW